MSIPIRLTAGRPQLAPPFSTLAAHREAALRETARRDAARATRTRVLVARMRKVLAGAAAVPTGAADLSAVRPARALVVAPHADDEVIGCGGLLWHLAERGTETSVVFLTREAKRSIATPSMVAGIPQRVREARAAQRQLGYDTADHLGLDERALHKADVDRRLRGALAPRVVTARPEVLIVPNFHEMHPDHRAAARATLRVTRALWEGGALPDLRAVFLYEIWGACPRVDGYFSLPEPAVDAVRRALTCYETQTATVDYLALLAELRESRARALGHPAPAPSPGEWVPAAPPPRWAEAYEILRSPDAIATYLAEAERAVPTTPDGGHTDGTHAL